MTLVFGTTSLMNQNGPMALALAHFANVKFSAVDPVGRDDFFRLFD